jgi:hypothetical protein
MTKTDPHPTCRTDAAALYRSNYHYFARLGLHEDALDNLGWWIESEEDFDRMDPRTRGLLGLHQRRAA